MRDASALVMTSVFAHPCCLDKSAMHFLSFLRTRTGDSGFLLGIKREGLGSNQR